MVFPCLSHNDSELTFIVLTDASFGNINGGTGSTRAYKIWLADNTGWLVVLGLTAL